MCRWLGYFGDPIVLEDLLYHAPHSLIEQSRHAHLQQSLSNADGFGLGWYRDSRERPGVYRNVAPAWSDANLRDLAAQIRSPLFLAHVRAATGTAVQQSNCHPFRHDRWVMVHNGFIDQFTRLRRELLLAVDPEFFPNIQGTTDSELIFHLALTFGLTDDPIRALEQTAGLVEEVGHSHGVAEPLQMTVGLSDGERLYAVRYASGPVVNSLYVSEDSRSGQLGGVRLAPGQVAGQAYVQNPQFPRLPKEARAVVSEPVADLAGLWHEVPPSSALVIGEGPDERLGFTPRPPG